MTISFELIHSNYFADAIFCSSTRFKKLTLTVVCLPPRCYYKNLVRSAVGVEPTIVPVVTPYLRDSAILRLSYYSLTSLFTSFSTRFIRRHTNGMPAFKLIKD